MIARFNKKGLSPHQIVLHIFRDLFHFDKDTPISRYKKVALFSSDLLFMSIPEICKGCPFSFSHPQENCTYWCKDSARLAFKKCIQSGLMEESWGYDHYKLSSSGIKFLREEFKK